MEFIDFKSLPVEMFIREWHLITDIMINGNMQSTILKAAISANRISNNIVYSSIVVLWLSAPEHHILRYTYNAYFRGITN